MHRWSNVNIATMAYFTLRAIQSCFDFVSWHLQRWTYGSNVKFYCPDHVTVVWSLNLDFPAPSSLVASPPSTVYICCLRSRANTVSRLLHRQVRYIHVFLRFIRDSSSAQRSPALSALHRKGLLCHSAPRPPQLRVLTSLQKGFSTWILSPNLAR